MESIWVFFKSVSSEFVLQLLCLFLQPAHPLTSIATSWGSVWLDHQKRHTDQTPFTSGGTFDGRIPSPPGMNQPCNHELNYQPQLVSHAVWLDAQGIRSLDVLCFFACKDLLRRDRWQSLGFQGGDHAEICLGDWVGSMAAERGECYP